MNSAESSSRGDQDPQTNETRPQLPPGQNEIAAEIDEAWAFYADQRVDWANAPDPYAQTLQEIAADMEAAWNQRRPEDAHPRSEEDRATARIFSGIIQWALAKNIVPPGEKEPVTKPLPRELQRFARSLSSEEIEEALAALPLEKFRRALHHAAKLATDERAVSNVNMQTPRPKSTPDERKVARARAAAYRPAPPATKKEVELVPTPYVSWAEVCSRYVKDLSWHPFSYDPEGHLEDRGMYNHPDLDQHPWFHGKEFNASGLEVLGRKIIAFANIPTLEKGQSLEEVIAALPVGTPYLAFRGDRSLTTGRSSRSAELPDARTLEKDEAALLNIFMLKSFREGGRAVPKEWLRRVTGWPANMFNLHFRQVVKQVTTGSGMMNHTKQNHKLYYRLRPNGFVVDARQLERQTNTPFLQPTE